MHEAGGKPSAFKLDKLLVQEKQTQYPWMSEVSKWVRQKALQDVEVAFRHFFRRVKSGQKPYGYPKFKKRGKCRDSFYINANHLRVEGRRIRVPYLGWVRMRQPLRFEGRVLSATFSREADQWFASIQVELDDAWDYPHRCENQAVVGLDFGLRELIVASDGKRVPCPRSFRRLEKKLKKANRRLVRRVKGSHRREKARLQLQKVHQRIRRVRQDVTHKATTDISKRFRFIGIEDLNVKGMARNHHLAKSVADAAMREVRTQLEYKVPLAGGYVAVADRFFPSSKLCHACGEKNLNLGLGERGWTCTGCGTAHDRDTNASKNLEFVALGYRETLNARGEEPSTLDLWVLGQGSSVKREASSLLADSVQV